MIFYILDHSLQIKPVLLLPPQCTCLFFCFLVLPNALAQAFTTNAERKWEVPASLPFLLSSLFFKETPFSWMAFIKLMNFPSIPSLLSFYHKCVLNFVKFFFCKIISLFINYTVIDSVMLKQFCIPGTKPTFHQVSSFLYIAVFDLLMCL